MQNKNIAYQMLKKLKDSTLMYPAKKLCRSSAHVHLGFRLARSAVKSALKSAWGIKLDTALQHWQYYVTKRPVPHANDIKWITLISSRGLGDLLMMTPSARMIKHLRPDIRVSIATSDKYAHLLHNLPHIDDIITTQADNRNHNTYMNGIAQTLQKNMAGSASDIIYMQSPFTQPYPHPHPYLLTSVMDDYEGYQYCHGAASPTLKSFATRSLYASKYQFMDPLLLIFGGHEELKDFLADKNNLAPIINPAIFEVDTLQDLRAQWPLPDRPACFINLVTSVQAKIPDEQTNITLLNRIANAFSTMNILVNIGTDSKINYHPDNISEHTYMKNRILPYVHAPNVFPLPALPLIDLARLMNTTTYYLSMDTGLPHLFSAAPLNRIPGFVIHNSRFSTSWSIPNPQVTLYVPSGNSSFDWFNSRPLVIKNRDKLADTIIQDMKQKLPTKPATDF